MEKENKNSKSKISANNRYVEKAYDKFTFRLPKGNREKLQEIAQKKYGGSINAFLTDAVIDKLKGVEGNDRSARFVAAIAAVFPDGKELVTRGTMEGLIAREPAGENGFGYDPIVYIPEYGCCSAQLSPEEKNKISHRGKALRKMKEELIQYIR